MRLTQWTDYTLRVLMYCAACRTRAQPVTISEIAQSHDISRSHLTKIVHQLGTHGLLANTRGRGGGIALLKDAKDINLGEVVRLTETDFMVVECFDASSSQCALTRRCQLKGVLQRATQSFLAVLDGVTLQDVVAGPSASVKPPTSRKPTA